MNIQPAYCIIKPLNSIAAGETTLKLSGIHLVTKHATKIIFIPEVSTALEISVVYFSRTHNVKIQ